MSSGAVSKAAIVSERTESKTAMEEAKSEPNKGGNNDAEKSGGGALAEVSARVAASGNTSCNASGNDGNALKLPDKIRQRFFAIKQKVLDAIAAHRTFMIYGRARVIRECMLQRGWCEKYFRRNADLHLNVESSPLVLLNGIGDLGNEQNERLLIAKMLTNHTVDFLWNTGVDWQCWPSQKNKTTIFNRYTRATFTSKIGLSANVRQMMWYYEPGISHTLFPRCYNLCQNDQMESFVDDFRLTACMSLLKWLVDKVNTEGEGWWTRSVVVSGTVPIKALDFAIKRCADYIKSQSHEDIDQEMEKVWPHQWDQFITWYYKIIHGNSLFFSNGVSFNKYYLAASQILKRMRKHWQQIDMDGMLNIWIVKPGNRSRGRGIVLMNKLEDVLSKTNPVNKTDSRYVVQKYIERPFLIYETKFDIRQWFLITRTFPLTIWMYKDSYLRFCTKKFSLLDFHESIHLCNNSIQCKYTNDSSRDPALPQDNMWDAATFKEFLKNQGHGNVWDEIIYPGMKQGLIGSLLTSQEAMDQRKNSFELFGADFMVMEDFSIWLIEINSHPDLSYSTSVTTRLCRQVLEDTIKVVIDQRENKNVDTGQFELVYKQRISSCQPYLGSTLSIQGTRLSACDRRAALDSKLYPMLKTPSINQKKSPLARYHIGPVIVDLIEELEMQLDQDLSAYFNTETAKLKDTLPLEILPEIKRDKQVVDNETETILSTCESMPSLASMTLKTPAINQRNKISEEKAIAKPVPKKILRARHNNSVVKVSTDMMQMQQNLYKRMADFAKQTTKSRNDSSKNEQSSKKEPNDGNGNNIIASTMKEVIIRYNRNESLTAKALPKQSLPTPLVDNSSSASILKKKKIRKVNKKRNSKPKNVNVPEIFAVGLALKQ